MKRTQSRDADGTAVSGLVLGYDGGCAMCAALAERARDASDGVISLRNLHDPEVRGWRERAFGKNAPWAPTLFEVGDGRVRAWTGVGMVARLGLTLGPVRAWRALRALGEYEAPAARQDSARGVLSRSRFLRTAGGAAVAASVLSGVPLLASPASALTTAEKKKIATSVVRNSAAYKQLAALQAKVGAAFDFANAKVSLSGTAMLTVVSVASIHSTRSIAASFLVDLKARRMYWYRHQVIIPVSTRRTQHLSYIQGEPLKVFDQVVREGDPRVVLSDDPVVTSEGETFTAQTLGEEAAVRNEQLGPSQVWVDGACDRCTYDAYQDCMTWTDAATYAPYGAGSAIGLWFTFTGTDVSFCESFSNQTVLPGGRCCDECNGGSTGEGDC